MTLVAVACLSLAGSARADRTPLIGTGTTSIGPPSHASSTTGLVVSVNPDSVPCQQSATFDDVAGGESPGTNYNGLLWSGGIQFAERFMGQAIGYSGDFDVPSGAPSSPLILQTGAAGQNLDVFDYVGSVLAGLGPLGYPDLDAIGEGSIAMVFPNPQSRISMDLVGGNGGSATLSFYRANGTLIDNVTVTGLADLTYGFAMADGSSAITGILIQNSDASGMGVTNICYGGGIASSRPVSWSRIRRLYR